MSPASGWEHLSQEVDQFGTDLNRALLLHPVTAVGQKHDLAQLRQSGLHRLEIVEAHGAIAFSAHEEHRLFHSHLTKTILSQKTLPVILQVAQFSSHSGRNERPTAYLAPVMSAPLAAKLWFAPFSNGFNGDLVVIP